MTRAHSLALVTLFLVGGTAFGQPPPGAPVLPSEIAMTPGEPSGPPVLPMHLPSSGASDATRLWGTADYLVGWVRGDSLPPLVTTSPAGTAQASAGVLGGNTSVLFGAANANTQARSGVRAGLGYWLDADRTYAVEAGGFLLASSGTSFAASSDGTRILARPFTDATTGQPASALIAFPGKSAGSVYVNESARAFYGGNVGLRENFVASSWCRLDALLGYRYLRFDERLQVEQSVVPTAGPFVAGTTIRSTDSFATRNVFNGVDLGLRAELWYEAWSLDLLGKVAAGAYSRTANIGGNQVVSVPGAPSATSTGGLLALTSNFGSHSRHTATAVPEVGLNLGYQLTQSIRLRAGYSFLWFPSAVRPGDQIDLMVNSNLIPPPNPAGGGPAHPAALTQTSSLYVQTISFGLEVRY